MYSERTQHVLIQESVSILDMEPPCTKQVLSQYRGICPQCMLVDDLEEERDQENVVPIPIPPPAICLDTPRPPTILQELIPIEAPAPTPAVEVEEGEDNAWYIPPIHHHRIYPLDKFTTAAVEPVPEYVEDHQDDPVAGPSRDNLAVDGLEGKMWANLRVNRRAMPAE